MNIHKEKCKRLKAIRKKLADGLGIDLKQRECTFEGECRGTCPKCRQEEEALNRALLGKAAAVAVSAGIMLTGCQGEAPIPEELPGNMMPPSEELELDGDIMMPPPEEFELDGDIMMPPPEEFELDGDIMMPPSEEIDLEKVTDDLTGEIPMDYEIEGDIAPGDDERVPAYENEE